MNFMEELLLKSLSTVGSSGIIGLVLWTIAKRFMDETVKQMSSRIDSLEKATEECAKDRREMHREIVELARKANHDE